MNELSRVHTEKCGQTSTISPEESDVLKNIPNELFLEVMKYLGKDILMMKSTNSRFYYAATMYASNSQREKFETFGNKLIEFMKNEHYLSSTMENCSSVLNQKRVLGTTSLLDIKKDYTQSKISLAMCFEDDWRSLEKLKKEISNEALPIGFENFFEVVKVIQTIHRLNFYEIFPDDYRKSQMYEKLAKFSKEELSLAVEILCYNSKFRFEKFIYVLVNLILEGKLNNSDEKYEINIQKKDLKIARKLTNLIREKIQENLLEKNPVDFKMLCLEKIHTRESLLGLNNEEIDFQTFLQKNERSQQIKKMRRLKNFLIRFFDSYKLEKIEHCLEIFNKVNFTDNSTEENFQTKLVRLKYLLADLFVGISKENFKSLCSLINPDILPNAFLDFELFYLQFVEKKIGSFYKKYNLDGILNNWQIESIKKHKNEEHFSNILKYLPKFRYPSLIFYTSMAFVEENIEKAEEVASIFLE